MEACSKSTDVKGDAWLGSITVVSELALCGFEATKSWPLSKKVIEDALKESPGGGVHIVLKGTLHESTILAIGYRYNSKKSFFLL
jgi:hypothetical protein